MLILLTTGINPAGLLIVVLAYIDQWHEMAKMPLLLYIKTKIVKDQSRLSCIQLNRFTGHMLPGLLGTATHQANA
jgi:hypothetical protein